MANKAKTIEDAKDELSVAIATKDWDAAARALSILHTLDDPETLRSLAEHHASRRHGARRRLKVELAQGIRAKLERATHAEHPNGNTWRDGFVRGLEDAHAHVQGTDEKDPDGD